MASNQFHHCSVLSLNVIADEVTFQLCSGALRLLKLANLISNNIELLWLKSMSVLTTALCINELLSYLIGKVGVIRCVGEFVV